MDSPFHMSERTLLHMQRYGEIFKEMQALFVGSWFQVIAPCNLKKSNFHSTVRTLWCGQAFNLCQDAGPGEPRRLPLWYDEISGQSASHKDVRTIRTCFETL
jgi:hypothetical protein